MEEIVKVFGINWKLLLIQGVNFGVLLLILWRLLYRPLISIISKRQEAIKKGVEDANKAEEKLNEINEEKESIITSATLEGEEIVQKATEAAKVREAELLKEANLKGERVLSEADLKAEELKRLALEESRGEIARIAVLGAEKVLRQRE